MSYRKILHKLFLYIKKDQKQYFDYLKAMEDKSKEEILLSQSNQLKDIILRAYKTTPYYKRLYDQNGFTEDKITSGEYSIEDLPILTKSALSENLKELVSNDSNPDLLRVGSTGGSTGQPVSYYFTEDIIDKMNAVLHIFFMRCGWVPGEKILHFWGAKQDLKKSKSIKVVLSQWIKSEKTLPAYEFDEETLNSWYQELISYRPAVIQGYASVLANLAAYIRQNDFPVPVIKGIYSTAEILYPTQRKLLEDVFDTKVFDQYGCREIPGIACECKYGNMHIMTEMAYVESVKDNGEDTGRLIITSLVNQAMPLIRYEVGDTGNLKEGSCECGLPYPIMEMGMCRSNDIIKTKSGKHIYPSYFVHLMDEFDFVKQYQFRQVSIDKVDLHVVTNVSDECFSVMLKKITAKIQSDYSNELDLMMIKDTEICKTTSGKYRFVISEL